MAHSALPRGHRKVFPSSFAMSKWELCLGPQYTHSCGNRKSSQQTVSACITMPERAHMSAISLLSLRLRAGSAERKGQFAALMPSEAGAHSYGTDSSPTRSRTLCRLNSPHTPQTWPAHCFSKSLELGDQGRQFGVFLKLGSWQQELIKGMPEILVRSRGLRCCWNKYTLLLTLQMTAKDTGGNGRLYKNIMTAILSTAHSKSHDPLSAQGCSLICGSMAL